LRAGPDAPWFFATPAEIRSSLALPIPVEPDRGCSLFCRFHKGTPQRCREHAVCNFVHLSHRMHCRPVIQRLPVARCLKNLWTSYVSHFLMTPYSSQPLVSLRETASDLLFRPPLVMAKGGVGSYVHFNLQKTWSICFRRLLLPIVVEHSTPLLRPLHICGVFCWWGL
jgi:hypothetical protein